MRNKNRNPASKQSSGLHKKAKGGLPDRALVFFNKLGKSRSLWTVPWQQPAEKQQADDHFGSESLWILAGGAAREEEGSEKKEKRREEEFQTRVNPEGDEVDCDDTSGIPRVVRSGGDSKPGPT